MYPMTDILYLIIKNIFRREINEKRVLKYNNDCQYIVRCHIFKTTFTLDILQPSGLGETINNNVLDLLNLVKILFSKI